jgi:hypothetical protein
VGRAGGVGSGARDWWFVCALDREVAGGEVSKSLETKRVANVFHLEKPFTKDMAEAGRKKNTLLISPECQARRDPELS